jgi:hypothetical protein
MTEHNWTHAGFRPIPGYESYEMNTGLDVWSLPREVPCKGGGTRTTPPKLLKPSHDGRVTLSCNGKPFRFRRDVLYKMTFPELVDVQAVCRRRHPLVRPTDPQMFGSLADAVQPRIARWGTGHRICLSCNDLPEAFAVHTYSRVYGSAGLPEYRSGEQATPVQHQGKLRHLYSGDELDWADIAA